MSLNIRLLSDICGKLVAIRNGAKFRPPTGVKVLSKHLTKSGTISSGHPGLDEDLKRIKEVQERVEDLVISYKEKYGEKPPVEWLEKEFEKPTEQIRTDLQDLLCHWDNYIEEKQQTVRSKKTVDRINNVRYTLLSFKQTKNYNLTFNQLDQRFFNDLIGYMIKEHKHFRNKHQRDPGIRKYSNCWTEQRYNDQKVKGLY